MLNLSTNNKKNILVITDSYFPKNNSGAIMLGDMVNHAKDNFNFIIITFDPNIKDNYSMTLMENQIIIYLKVWSYSNYIKRFLSEIFYSKKIINFFNDNSFIKIDFIISYSPSIFFGNSIRALKKKFSCDSYLIQRDIFPEWAYKQGLIKSKFIYNFFKQIEDLNYKTANYIGVESYGSLKYLKKKGFNNVELLNNWIKDSNHKTLKNKKDTYKYFIYSGNLGLAQDFLNLLKKIDFKELKKNKIKILICGAGKQKEQIIDHIEKFSLNTVKYLGELSRQDYLNTLAKCKAGIVSLSIKTFMSNYPFKFIDYIRNEIPVIAHINPNNELNEFIKNNKIGFCSNANNYDNFNYNLIHMSNAKEYSNLKKNCKKTFNKYFNIDNALNAISSKIK